MAPSAMIVQALSFSHTVHRKSISGDTTGFTSHANGAPQIVHGDSPIKPSVRPVPAGETAAGYTSLTGEKHTINPMWQAVEDYFTGHLNAYDDGLDGALDTQAKEGLPSINVPPSQGRSMGLMARSMGAKRILEVGTLGGYSTIHFARALPKVSDPSDPSYVTTLELNPVYAGVALKSWERAGVEDRINLVLGPAARSLKWLYEEKKIDDTGLPGHVRQPYDMAFIDADKVNIALYFDICYKLVRPGGTIIVDNVVRQGKIVPSPNEEVDANVRGVRKLIDLLDAEKGEWRDRVDSTVIQIVSEKSWDGYLQAVVRDVE